MGLVGVALAAAQLLPTLELSRLSVRGSGLPYQEAVSFSLKPGFIFKAFLPPLVWEPPWQRVCGLHRTDRPGLGRRWGVGRACRSQAADSPERGVSSYGWLR